MTKKARLSGDPCSSKLEEQVHYDRISNLPDNVISQILMCLPIREAVGTSRLSTTWRGRWMSIPELVFRDRGAQKFVKWVNFIHNVLLLHEGNITQFEIRDFSDSASSNLDCWLLFLSRKKFITTLCIQFRRPSSYICPSSLFSFQDLTVLKLYGCRLQVPPQTQFMGFKNLTQLFLIYVYASKDAIEYLVNTSPFLRVLHILKSKPDVFNLNICAPNLTHCTIKWKCECITFAETPKLKFIDIKTCVNEVDVRCKLDKKICELLQLQEAKICHPFIQCLSVNNFVETLPVTYHQLKTISLEICFEDPKQILAAVWLFRNSPSLKKFFISWGEHFKRDERNEDLCLDKLYEMLGKEEAILQSLEVFKIGRFWGTEKELKLVEFVLLKASVLRTMTIDWDKNAMEDTVRMTNALVELVKFQRTSSTVKINISSPLDLGHD